MPLAGGHELLLTHQEISGLGEDHRGLRRIESIVLQRQGQQAKGLVEEPKSFSHRPEERVGNDTSFVEGKSCGIKKLQKCPKTSSKDLRRSREVSRKIKAREKAKPIGTDLTHKGTGFPKLEPSAIERVFNMARHFMELTSREKERILTSDINDLKKNDRTFTKWCKVTNARLESISNKCDRIERKFGVQHDELEDLSITNINNQLTILKNHALEIVDNTNLFALNLERSDSEIQKLQNEIIEHGQKIHNNYEPNSAMPRHSKPLTEENISFKESLTPFPGERIISARDIPKLE
ncbi:hypothetical protein O181_081681 [Austropuccinia psidii MF-1]|uniref:Uncharacterized protein n=1 Tax=Austropuccinia psidii MF-1 TaxID=1389203 RepID=A0A9Q3FKP0_9BASI|nr:hypothetical protein [Austropuccinia psidii MF-1]